MLRKGKFVVHPKYFTPMELDFIHLNLAIKILPLRGHFNSIKNNIVILKLSQTIYLKKLLNKFSGVFLLRHCEKKSQRNIKNFRNKRTRRAIDKTITIDEYYC